MPGSQLLALLLPLQGLLKKHEAFETDFTVHKDRVNDVCTNGQDLVKKVSLAHWSDPPFRLRDAAGGATAAARTPQRPHGVR